MKRRWLAGKLSGFRACCDDGHSTLQELLLCYECTVVLGGAFHDFPPNLGPLNWRPSFFYSVASSPLLALPPSPSTVVSLHLPACPHSLGAIGGLLFSAGIVSREWASIQSTASFSKANFPKWCMAPFGHIIRTRQISPSRTGNKTVPINSSMLPLDETDNPFGQA